MTEDFIATFLASYLIWFMFATLFFLWVYRKRLERNQIAHVVAVVITSLLVSQLIKAVFPTPRPFVVQGIDPLTVTVPADSAFPSAHTAIAFGIVFAMLRHDKRLSFMFLPSAALVGVGRMISHVHYPIDVVGGILVAALVAFIFNKKWITS